MSTNTKTLRDGTNENTSAEDEENVSREALEITMDKRLDLAVAVGVALLGMFILITSRDIRTGSLPDPVTSRGLPNIAGALLVIGGIVV